MFPSDCSHEASDGGRSFFVIRNPRGNRRVGVLAVLVISAPVYFGEQNLQDGVKVPGHLGHLGQPRGIDP